MSSGSAAHLYAGAIRRGRSGRTVSLSGLEGWKGSCGQEMVGLLVAINVGAVNAAVSVWQKWSLSIKKTFFYPDDLQWKDKVAP
jgi:hypothetical protein